jgi:demethylmenaquinone methyltransferase/2-methoxy-6-polyprenyl-1,4-benzoquinol methylase
MLLGDQIATPEGHRRYVRQLFATIADRYDLITRVLSYGRDRHWKRRLLRLAAVRASDRVLDLATGTGDLAYGAAARSTRVVGLDIAPRMIAHARARGASGPTPLFLVGDMVSLPFRSASFDVVTTGYGLRNVPDLTAAIDEIVRVLKPTGAALSLDFDRPPNATVRAVFLVYLTIVGGVLGRLLHGDPDTYRYIPASIRKYPGAGAVTQLMRQRGFSRVRHHRVLGGLMAIHHALK